MKAFLTGQWKALAGALGGLAIAIIDFYTGGGTVATIEQAMREVGGALTNMAVGWTIVYFSPANRG